MKTKLVYVLTCSPESNYLEQAVLATFSARHHNPTAHIVLIVDDKTDELIRNGNTEILKYINERIVVPFEEDKTMVYRSRWIKTSVRNLINGDFLFVDCDTVTTGNLDRIDSFECCIGAIPDSHLRVIEFGKALKESSMAKVSPIGIDLDNEEYYFSSGVLYVKDTPETHLLYDRWHSIWEEGIQRGINIDQPSLAKANIEEGHIIKRIPDDYNCVIYTQPDFAKDASILHFTAYRNPSWLFSARVLDIIRKEGICDWLVPYIINPVLTYVPFRYTLSKMSFRDMLKKIKELGHAAKDYSHHVDPFFSDMKVSNRWQKRAKVSFKLRRYFIGSVCLILPAWIFFKTKRSRSATPNICAK